MDTHAEVYLSHSLPILLHTIFHLDGKKAGKED
jgi:hypothetical protein